MPPNPNWPAEIPIPEATEGYLSPDTKETTRIDFTDFFLRFRHAEAMKPNLQQTFSTLYFMWDFVLRTFQHLAAQVSPQVPKSSLMFGILVARTSHTKQLILDTTGKLEAMNASVGYSDDGGIEFGDEILALAATLDVPEGLSEDGLEGA
ncbi:hypothetical protein BDW02DRAFT_643106 [Decorospora gaudefroyi]|uniref:Uncharacterized protein n=1 Tax=Decorospora gaudefroyi TaxID=184978 RepID=A0A6A5K383_9PLEO|nr:hypothetical protein BDW02DRAFT_643106 [Decorospora gaudefroyi]